MGKRNRGKKVEKHHPGELMSQPVAASKKKAVSSYQTTYQECDHWRTPVKVGEHEMWATGLFDKPLKSKVVEAEAPDLGVYCDRQWLAHLGGVAGLGIDGLVKPCWPFLVMDWKDMADFDDEIFANLVGNLVALVEEGKRVEVACLGGHGRTGTVIAAVIAKVERLSAKDAIDGLRKRYCSKAVESYTQEDSIYRFLGEEPPPLPPMATYQYKPKVVAPGNKYPDWHGNSSWWQGDDNFGSYGQDATLGEIADKKGGLNQDEIEELERLGVTLEHEELCFCNCLKAEHRGNEGPCENCVNCPAFALDSFALFKSGKDDER